MEGGIRNGGYAAPSKTPDLTVGNMEQIASMNSSDFSAWISSEECHDILARALEVARAREIEHTMKAKEYARKRMDLEKALRERGKDEKEEQVAPGENKKHGGTDIQNVIREIEQGTIDGLSGTFRKTSPVDAVHLAEALEKMARKKQSSVKTLKFANIKIMDEGVMAFSRVIANENSLLEEVDFFHCGMTGIGATALAEALMKNRTVRKVKISANFITAAIDAIAKALEVNTSIVELEMGHCKIDCGGAKSLARALENSALKCLKVNGNEEMGVEGLAEIAMALKKNTSLEEVDFGSCGIDDDFAKKMAMVLDENHATALRKIMLRGGTITEAGADLLVQALNVSNNKTVKIIAITMSNVPRSLGTRIQIH